MNLDELGSHLRSLEEEMFRTTVRKDGAAMGSMLAEEFREFGASGRMFGRAEILAELAGETEREIALRDFEVEVLAEGVALATYRAVRREVGVEAIESLRSSVWVERDGRWQMVFHQGTVASKRKTKEGDDVE
jgi:hypothetical protein